MLYSLFLFVLSDVLLLDWKIKNRRIAFIYIEKIGNLFIGW